MKAFRSVLIAGLIIACGASAFAQKKYDKLFSKADKYYNAGRYPKALSTLSKFKKSATAKLGPNNPYMPGYYIREAKVNLNAGILTGFDNSLNNAINTSIAINGADSAKHASVLLDVASVYSQYGYYRLSREYSILANNILVRANKTDDELQARIILETAEALTGQGLCNQAIQLLRENEQTFAKRAIEKETYVDDGKIKTRRIPEEELTPRFSSYARMLTLIGEAYAKQGFVNSADSAFEASRTWIRQNQRYLGENSLDLVYTNFLNARMLAENNNGILPPSVKKYMQYSDLLSELKKRTSPATPLAHELYLAYLDELQHEGANAKYANLKGEYDRMLGKYFSKSSLMNINLKAVEFDSKLSRDRTKTLESDALSIINSKSLPRNYPTTVRVLEFLYGMSLQANRYSNAENYLGQIVEIKKELNGANSTEYHLAQIELAEFYLDYTNKIDVAEKIFTSSYTNMVSKEIGPWHKDHLDILNHLARLYELTDKYQLANTTLEKASSLARAKYSDTDPDFGVELDNIASLQLKLGSYDKAEQNIDRALKILKDYRKDEARVGQYIHAIETQAKLYGIKGLFDEAQDNLDQTRKIIKKSDVSLSSELATAEDLSSLYIQLGRYSETDKLLNKLLTEYEKLFGANSIRLIEPLVNKGRILLARGDYPEADKTATRANQIALKTYGDASTKTASTQKLLSDIYYTLGDYERAEENIIKTISSQEKQFGRNHVDVARSISQLALIKFYKGDDKNDIEKLMLEARDIMANKLGKDNPQYADIMKNVAVLYISQSKNDIAFNSLTIAENIWRTKTGTKNNINAASIYTLTGDLYYQLKNYKLADDFYNRAKDLYEKFFSANHPEYVKVLSKLSRVYYMQKDYKKSKRYIEQALDNYENFIKSYFPALSEREKAKYWNTIKGDFEFYNTLAFSQLEDFKDLTSKVYNYQLLTKALLLSSSIKVRERILNSTDEQLRTLYSTWQQKKEQLTVAISMGPAQLEENEIDPAELTQEVEKLEKLLSQQSELFSQSFEAKKITFDDVRKSLKPTEVAVEIVRFRYFNHSFTDSIVYAALYIKNDSKKPSAVVLSDGSKMEGRNLNYYRNAIIGKIQDNVSYNVYWGPIQKELGQVSNIFLSADGVYNQINLESIPTPDGKYILDNSNIVLVSNTKDLYLNKIQSRQKANNVASMFGNPTFYASSERGNILQLPGAENEISQLDFILKQKGWITNDYIENLATEEQIKTLDNPKIFHVATHGLYKPEEEIDQNLITRNEAQLAHNPLMRTGLLFKGAGDLLLKTPYNYNTENGILTAYEAMSLNLDRTDLVVLSACETARGELQAGEGVFGLQRAFLVAGAKVLVMSLFKVDDEATLKLMTKFYQKWLNTGNMRQSFIDAKKEIRAEYPDPINWGSFIMMGLE